MTEHAFRLERAGDRDVIACPCGWRSEPMHVINTDAAYRKHITSTAHDHTREETRLCIRAICSCGWKGRWRSRERPQVEKQLHSDDGEHIYAVKRGEA